MFIDGFIRGTAEGYKLLRDDPIQISIFYPFVVLVFCQVEGLVIEPAQLDGILQPTKAIQ